MSSDCRQEPSGFDGCEWSDLISLDARAINEGGIVARHQPPADSLIERIPQVPRRYRRLLGDRSARQKLGLPVVGQLGRTATPVANGDIGGTERYCGNSDRHS